MCDENGILIKWESTEKNLSVVYNFISTLEKHQKLIELTSDDG